MPQAEEKIDDPVVAAKKRELELAQLDAQIADERQKRIAKLFPDGPASIEPPKLTVDDKVSIQSEVLAYRALGAVAVGIVERIAGRPDAPRAYVIHTAEVVAALAAFRSFEMRISAFEQIFSEIAPALSAF